MQYIPTERGRLDKFLASAQPELSRVKAGALIRRGCVLLNGRIVRKPAHIVRPGDTVEVSDHEEPVSESHLTPVDLKLKVLYEDAACLVIAKPAGVAVHPAPGIPKSEPTILHGIAYLFGKKRGRYAAPGFSASTTLVHRLDRETTGCLLIAKSAQAHASLQKQFKDRTIQKTYLAVVAGIPREREAMIDAPVGRSTTDRTKMSVLGASKSRSAQTTYRVLSTCQQRGKHPSASLGTGATLLACDLHTGRTHQIRVHLKAIGHPILGDRTYGSPESETIARSHKIHDLALHAWKLSFVSPAKKAMQHITAPPLPTFKRALKNLDLR